jgi:hypothetical protein
MAKSFAVWVEGKLDNNQQSCVSIDELHINFWCTRNPMINCIDFGVKFSCQRISSDDITLNIFIPFPISKERIKDLSVNMDSNKDLVSAIFNDYISATRNVKTKHVVYSLASNLDTPLALNTSLDFNDLDGRYDDRVKVIVNHEFTKISFKLSKCVIDSDELAEIENSSDLKYYIRLRLDNLTQEEMNVIIHKTENSDKYLKPFKDELVVIDFRVNELRVLPKDIKISLANAFACPMKYHLFVIRDETDEYQLSHSGKSYKKCRILEGETWQKYFEDNTFKKEQSSMIYHWEKDCSKNPLPIIKNENILEESNSNNHARKKSGYKITDFIAVAKFRQTESPIYTILVYLSLVVIISVCSNFIYDLIKYHFKLFIS